MEKYLQVVFLVPWGASHSYYVYYEYFKIIKCFLIPEGHWIDRNKNYQLWEVRGEVGWEEEENELSTELNLKV